MQPTYRSFLVSGQLHQLDVNSLLSRATMLSPEPAIRALAYGSAVLQHMAAVTSSADAAHPSWHDRWPLGTDSSECTCTQPLRLTTAGNILSASLCTPSWSSHTAHQRPPKSPHLRSSQSALNQQVNICSQVRRPIQRWVVSSTYPSRGTA